MDKELRGAVKQGNVSLLSSVIASIPRGQLKQDIDGGDKAGRSPAHWAAFNGNSECLKVLLLANADPNKEDNSGRTPLHWAAFKNHAECIKILLNSDANPNVVNQAGQTPLHGAACEGHAECTKLLLKAGADPNAADQNEWTPLYLGAEKGSTECVKLLLKAKADPNKGDASGWTPLHWTQSQGHTECSELLRRYGGTSSGAASQTCGGGATRFEALQPPAHQHLPGQQTASIRRETTRARVTQRGLFGHSAQLSASQDLLYYFPWVAMCTEPCTRTNQTSHCEGDQDKPRDQNGRIPHLC